MGHSIPFCLFLGFLLAEFATLLTTVYLHRGSTHRAIKFHPVVEFFMQAGLWLMTGIKRVEWVAVHLCHHAHADKDGDPHSPLLLGLWRVQLGNFFLYRKAAKDPKVLAYARHLKLTLAEETIFRSQVKGLLLGTAILCLSFGIVPGLLIAATHSLLYLFFLNNLINGWCHARGYKNFPDAVAFNNRLIALITVGEGLHNNHHHAPSSPSLRYRKSEIDVGWIFIRLLTSLGLAEV